MQKLPRATTALNFLHGVSKGVLGVMDFQNNGSTSRIVDFLNLCFKNHSSISLNLLDVSEPDQTLRTLYPYFYNVFENSVLLIPVTDCQIIFDEFKREAFVHYFVFHLNLIPSHIPTKNIEELLKENRLHLFYNKSSNAKHQECFSMETEVLTLIDTYLSEFQEVDEIWRNLTKAPTIQEASVLAEKLLPYYSDIIHIGLMKYEYLKKLSDACDGTKSFIEDFLRVDPRTISPTQEEALLLLQDIQTSLDKIRETYVKLHRHYATGIHSNIFENLQSYLVGNITKMELGTKLRSKQKSFALLYEHKEDLRAYIKEYSTKMTLAAETLVNVYKRFVTLEFPLINIQDVYELELVKKAAAINDSRMQEIVDNLKLDVTTFLPELIRECCSRLIKIMEEVTDGLVKPVEDVVEQLDELGNDLEIYRTSTRMDTDFFM